MSLNNKLFIILGALISLLVFYFGGDHRKPASIPDHKKIKIEDEINKYDKPRASVRLNSDPVEQTEHGTFILRASVKGQINELQYIWHLPDSARVFRGTANGILGEDVNQIEIEIGLDDPSAQTNINLEVYYFENGIKLGNVKNFELNKPSEPSEKFDRAKSAFEEDLKKIHKIVQ